MIRILKIILIFIITSSSNADVVGNTLDNVSEKISEYTIGLIPGEGYTETSIDLRENFKPDYSILAVRELMSLDNGNIF